MQAILDAVAATRNGDRGLPNEVYRSAGFFQWEYTHLFAPGWFAIGFAQDVARPGDMRRVDAFGRSYLLVRDAAGEVRVFHNVCRHRGRRLLDDTCRHAAAIRCPYHAWTYDLDGSLRGTPHIGGAGRHRVAGFEQAEYHLWSVRSAVWMGIVLVNPNGEAAPCQELLAPLDRRLARLWGEDGHGAFQPAGDGTLDLEVASNWKLAVENYLEAYHLPMVHPGLNRYSPLASHYCYHDEGNFAGQGVTAYLPDRAIDRPLPSVPGWSMQHRTTAEYPALYPNTLLGVQHDHLFVMILLPLAHDRTLERVAIQFVDPAASDESWREGRRQVLEGWRSVFAEDVAAVEGMQAGRFSDAFDGGVFTPVQDQATRHFHRWFAERAAAAGHPPPPSTANADGGAANRLPAGA